MTWVKYLQLVDIGQYGTQETKTGRQWVLWSPQDTYIFFYRLSVCWGTDNTLVPCDSSYEVHNLLSCDTLLLQPKFGNLSNYLFITTYFMLIWMM